MAGFGEQLRKFRQRCEDRQSPHGRLTQEKLGELIGEELGIYYSGAAISDWERGQSRIHADHRKVLVCLVRVLHACGGLKTLSEANELLESGNYRPLNLEETKILFPEGIDTMPSPESSSPPEKDENRKGIKEIRGDFFSGASREFQEIVIEAKEKGPSPYWPRVLVAYMRKVSDRLSISVTSVLWLAVWFLAWWMIGPSLRWPFVDRESAYSAIVMYAGATLIIPLLIGLLINSKDSEYWKERNLANSTLVRLYTYQGAGIGFNLGYFFVLPFVLTRHFLDLQPSIWLELAAVTLGLILGNMSARVVPHNLWVAYDRLRLADGAIFFVAALLGPLWALFFFEFYSVLLRPVWGTLLILLAVMIAVVIAARRFGSKAGDSKSM